MRKLFAIALSLLVPVSAQAALLQFDLGLEYTGGTVPAGAPAWMRATVDDGGGSGSVSLKIESLSLSGSEFVTGFYMNLDPALSLGSLTVSSPTKIGTFANPTVAFGANAFNAGGGSSFDLEVAFDNSPPANRFGAGESVTMTISGNPLLNANSFNYLSSGGSGSRSISAHVQGIGPSANQSGWITTTVPEPMGISLLGMGAMLLKRRR